MENGEEHKASEVAQPASVKPSEPLSTYTPPSPRVYMDDGEFYVSSEEVRIGEKKWKLEDVEYVNVEYFRGWLKRVIHLSIFCTGISLFLVNPLLTYIIITAHAIYGMLFYFELIKDHFTVTGYIAVRIHLRNGGTDKVQFGNYKKYEASVRKFSMSFHEAVFDTVKPYNYTGTSVPKLAASDTAGEKILLFNMQFNLGEITYACARDQMDSANIDRYIGSVLLIAGVVLLMFFYASGHDIEARNLFIFLMPILFFNNLSARHRIFLRIVFRDKTKRTISKWAEDDQNEALYHFARVFRMYKQERNAQEKLAKKLKRQDGGG